MCPDDMASIPELAYLRRREETRLANPIGCDEKVSPPSPFLERTGNVGVGTDASIVKRQNCCGVDLRNSVQMIAERRIGELVDARIGSGESAGIEVSGTDHIVVQKCNFVHAAFCLRSPVKMRLSCSTFSSHDSVF